LQEAAAAVDCRWRCPGAFEGGCRRSRIARECWRCCRLSFWHSKDPRRPCPQPPTSKIWACNGDRGIDDTESGEAVITPQEIDDGSPVRLESRTNSIAAFERTLASASFATGVSSPWEEEAMNGTASCSSLPADLEDIEFQTISDLRLRLEDQAGLKDLPHDLLHCCCRVSHNNVSRAYQRARDMFDWRQREGVDTILADPTALAAESFWRPLLHYGLPGRDRKCRPVLIQAVGRWDMKALGVAMRNRKSALFRSQVVMYETLRTQAREAEAQRFMERSEADCGGNAAVRADAAGGRRLRPLRWVIVLDASGLSISHARYPEVLSCLKEVSKLGSRYYPENVDRMFVVNASSSFHVIWRVISPFVKPNTRAKVRVLPEGDSRELLAECGPECIPEHLGGRLPADALPYITR